MEKRILNIAVKHWNDHSTGISSLDIADKLKISNTKAMAYLESLQLKGQGTLNENVTLYQGNITFNRKTKTVNVMDLVPVNTHIFFPSKNVLQTYYERNLKKYFKDGEYRNRLRTGGSQIALVYFDVKVLSKFLDNKEYYHLNDDITGGVVRLKHDVISEMTQEEYDEKGFDKIWYGKRLLANGEVAVAAILKDLSSLPVQEQSYWYGFEIIKPLLSENDSNFGKFVARAFNGEWVDSNDPIKNIYEVMSRINSVVPEPIFMRFSNPYLRYPTNNTFKDFADANSELYKIVGPDNLNVANLKNLYLTTLKGDSKNLTHSESKRPLTSLQILQLIIDNLDASIANRFKRHWNQIKDYRIDGDHKIIDPKKALDNYVSNFHGICENTVEILSHICNSLKQIIGDKCVPPND